MLPENDLAEWLALADSDQPYYFIVIVLVMLAGVSVMVLTDYVASWIVKKFAARTGRQLHKTQNGGNRNGS